MTTSNPPKQPSSGKIRTIVKETLDLAKLKKITVTKNLISQGWTIILPCKHDIIMSNGKTISIPSGTVIEAIGDGEMVRIVRAFKR